MSLVDVTAAPAGTDPHDEGRAAGWGLVLIACALATEALLLAGWLRLLSRWEAPTNLPAGAPMVLILGQTQEGALRWALPAVALILLWGVALWASARLRGWRWSVAALATGALFLLTLLPINPGGTQDIYHNVADVRLFWLHGLNPTLHAPNAVPDDPFFRHVWGYADLPSAYGPLWYELAGVTVALGGDGLWSNLIAQKAFVSAFALGTALLAVLAVRVVAPERVVLAAVLSLWSPLLLWETAGNGHNDSAMAFFLAASLLAAARRAYLWVLPLLILSALVKYTTVLALPVALVWLLRRPDLPRRTLAASLGIAALLTIASFAPLAAGADTVAALRRPGMTFILSPATLAHGWLTAWLAEGDASALVRAVSGLLFLAAYGWVVARSRGDARELAARCFDALFLYLLLASWWFWPWYVLWLAPAAALARGWSRVSAVVVMAGASLLTYLYWWPDPPFRSQEWFRLYAAITLAVFVAPAAVWAWGAARRSTEAPDSARALKTNRPAAT